MKKTYYLYAVKKQNQIVANVTSRYYPNKPSYCTEAASRELAAHCFACAGLLEASFCVNIFGPTYWHLTKQALEHFKLLPVKEYKVSYTVTNNEDLSYTSKLPGHIQAQTPEEARRELDKQIQTIVDQEPRLILCIAKDKYIVCEDEYPFKKHLEISDIQFLEA